MLCGLVSPRLTETVECESLVDRADASRRSALCEGGDAMTLLGELEIQVEGSARVARARIAGWRPPPAVDDSYAISGSSVPLCG